MLNLESIQIALSYGFFGASIIFILLAVSVTKGLPIKVLFAVNGADKFPKKFYLFMGTSFITLTLFNLLEGDTMMASLLVLLAALQFREYSLSEKR